jgi:hypothetical protein
MSGRRLSTLAVALLFAGVEIFAFIPQLHGCLPVAGRAATTAAGAAAAATTANGAAVAAGGASQALPAAEDCSACRFAGLVMAVQGAMPIAVPLPRVAEIGRPAAPRLRSVRLDRACGRAPPLRSLA